MRYQGQGKHEEVSPGIHGNRGEDFGPLQAKELGFGPGSRGLLWARELQWMSYNFPAQHHHPYLGEREKRVQIKYFLSQGHIAPKVTKLVLNSLPPASSLWL